MFMHVSTYEKWTIGSAAVALSSFLFVQKDPAVRKIALGAAGMAGGIYGLYKTEVITSLWQRLRGGVESHQPQPSFKRQLLTAGVGIGTVVCGLFAFVLGMREFQPVSKDPLPLSIDELIGEGNFVHQIKSCPAVHERRMYLIDNRCRYTISWGSENGLINGIDYIYQLCKGYVASVNQTVPESYQGRPYHKWLARVCQHEVAKSCIETMGFDKLLDYYADKFPGWYSFEAFEKDFLPS